MSEVNTGAVAPETASPEASETEVSEEAAAQVAAEPSAPTDALEKEAAGEKLSKEEKAEIKKWRLKIDGREEELTEDELVKHAQLGKAAHKRMQEAAQYKKNVAAFFETLKADPLRVLSDPSLGIPAEQLKKLAESVISNEIEDLKKTPEQREKEKLQRELESLKQRYKEEEESRKQSEFQRLQEQAALQLDNDIASALDTSGLPKSPYTVKKMAEYMLLALQNDIDLSAKDVVPIIKKQITSEIREMFSAAPEDLIEDFLGKDNISRLRKRAVARIKDAPKTAEQIKPSGAEAQKPKEEPKKIPFKEFFKPY